MIVLALDTALETCSVAVVRDGEPLAVRCEPMARGHQERLAPMVAEAMAEAALGFEALDRIAVTVGPGSFTGLRVGLAFAKAMSMALDISCVGVGTLEGLAASRPGWAAEPLLLAVLDGRREHVYLQAFTHGAPLAEPANLSIAEAVTLIAGFEGPASPPMVGSGSTLLPLDGRPAEVTQIDPVALARLAATRRSPAGRPAPIYLRAPDAKTIAERARLAAG